MTGLALLHFSALLIGYGVLFLVGALGAYILVGFVVELFQTVFKKRNK